MKQKWFNLEKALLTNLPYHVCAIHSLYKTPSAVFLETQPSPSLNIFPKNRVISVWVQRLSESWLVWSPLHLVGFGITGTSLVMIDLGPCHLRIYFGASFSGTYLEKEQACYFIGGSRHRDCGWLTQYLPVSVCVCMSPPTGAKPGQIWSVHCGECNILSLEQHAVVLGTELPSTGRVATVIQIVSN